MKRKPVAYTYLDKIYPQPTTVELGRFFIVRRGGPQGKRVASMAFILRTFDGGMNEQERQLADDLTACVREYIAKFNGKAWRREAKRGK